MRPLATLTAAEIAGVRRVAFDLDDTVLTDGKLLGETYAALTDLASSGFELVAITGRPASFAEIVARQWPVTAAIAENGALAYVSRPRGGVTLVDSCPADERARRRVRLTELSEVLRERFRLEPADDQRGRISDIAYDIGEHHVVAPEIIDAAGAHAREAGFRSHSSSIHLHVTLDDHDKASGFVALMTARGEDPTEALRTTLFVGDSPNDSAAFASFAVTVGVANVRAHLARLSVPPGFVTEQEKGLGFAELCRALQSLVGRSPFGPASRPL
jgi:HAD superfamily hydrolase (TIGR01484 family)